MAIFNSYVKLPEGIIPRFPMFFSHPPPFFRRALGPADEGGGGSLWALPGDRGFFDVGLPLLKKQQKWWKKIWTNHGTSQWTSHLYVYIYNIYIYIHKYILYYIILLLYYYYIYMCICVYHKWRFYAMKLMGTPYIIIIIPGVFI